MDVEGSKTSPQKGRSSKAVLPEVDVYLHLLLLINLLDREATDKVLRHTVCVCVCNVGWYRPLSAVDSWWPR